jgi:hypothetical protein
MPEATVVEWIRCKYVALLGELAERGRRRWAATEALSLGWGGIAAVAKATGISDRTIRNGIRELKAPDSLPEDRQRRPGAGRRAREEEQPELIGALESLVERQGEPAVSVDTKKKEVLGNRKNAGRTYRPKGKPVEVDMHDFPDDKLGKAIPYGVYDLQRNEAWVSVGIDHDTAAFAVASIEQWWKRMGRKRYGNARRLLITGDSGGSNGHRNRLWKTELQRLADRTGLILEVCHFPPGTSKWNKIEHRLFCHITRNWQGVPLETHEVVVNLIGSTRTSKGLEVHAWLDGREYPKGCKVNDEELQEVRIRRNQFQGDWNYEIHPRSRD